MGGNVSVKSEINKGTTFKIDLVTVCQLDKVSAMNLINNIKNKKDSQQSEYKSKKEGSQVSASDTLQSTSVYKTSKKLNKRIDRNSLNKEI